MWFASICLISMAVLGGIVHGSKVISDRKSTIQLTGDSVDLVSNVMVVQWSEDTNLDYITNAQLALFKSIGEDKKNLIELYENLMKSGLDSSNLVGVCPVSGVHGQQFTIDWPECRIKPGKELSKRIITIHVEFSNGHFAFINSWSQKKQLIEMLYYNEQAGGKKFVFNVEKLERELDAVKDVNKDWI